VTQGTAWGMASEAFGSNENEVILNIATRLLVENGSGGKIN
jgi:hypothetical protein